MSRDLLQRALDRLLQPLYSWTVCVFLIRAAAVLVPGHASQEWLAEWQAELWHIWHAAPSSASLQYRRKAVAFCLGAFPDAFLLRLIDSRSLSRRLTRFGSLSRSIASLALVAVVSLIACLALPAARQAIIPMPYPESDQLMLISRGGESAQAPTIRLAEYRSWQTSTRHLFSALAFYQPVIKRVHIAPHQAAELSIVRASGNLFELLNLSSFAPQQARGQSRAAFILSEEAWQKYFHADPNVTGRVVEIAGQQVAIAGVLPRGLWRLPGRADGWMLESETALNALPSHSAGYALGHIKASAFSGGPGGRHYMTVPKLDGNVDRFDCLPLSEQTRQPFSIFLFTLFVACLALPATTPLPLGEYPARDGRQPASIKMKRWIFLAAKLALIVPAVYFSSLALTAGIGSFDARLSQYTQLTVSFFGLLFAFRWALQDQRRRCPVCLRRLTNPAHVGESSRNFLAWNGTELICAGGHGLLHIPELPTSWFSTQRWLYLDPSWSSLFPTPI